MTIWKPTTCGTTELDRISCLVDLDSGTFIFSCAAHNIISVGTRLAAVQDENQRGWGNVWGEVLTIAPDAATKDNINLTWTWSGTAPNRVLTIRVTGITLNNPQKQNVQNKLDNRFGAGKVVATFG